MSAPRAGDLTNLNVEIAALVETIQEAERRLGELTHGEVDSVSDRLGRTFMLRGAQEQLRDREARRQAAILNALPGPIALLDPDGVIISVNAAWRSFGAENGLLPPNAALGVNYLEVCDRAKGKTSIEAPFAAAGIRAILSGRETSYFLEYPCNSPRENRWFLMTVHPLSEDLRDGAVVMHTNITERKRAEAALSELAHETEQKEKLLNTVLSHITDFAYIFDCSGRFLFANQPLLDLWRLPLESAVGKTFFELNYPPDLAAKLAREIQEVVTTRRVVSEEITFTSADGTEGSYEYILTPVTAADGSVEFVAGSTRDISERVRSANALRDAERQQRELAELLEVERSRLIEAQHVAKVGSWELDLSTMSLLWSEETFRIFERPPNGTPLTYEEFLSLVHSDDRDEVSRRLASSLDVSSNSFSIEHRILLPSGTMKFVEERWLVSFSDLGFPLRAIGTCQDITERVHARTALLQSQKHLRDIIDGLGPSMFVALLTPQGVLLEINRPPLEAAGLQPEDVLGKPFDETPWWTHSPAVQKQLRDAIQRAAGGEPSRYDVRIHGASEKIIDLDFSIQPLRDERGNVVFLIPSASVITDRKQTEEVLRQAQKMDAVGQLAAGVAHEFNNILQTVMSMATITRLRSLDPEIVKMAGDMETQIRRGASVTQQLLLVSRHQQLSKAKFDVGEELRTAGALLRRLLPENIDLVVSPSAPAWVEGDAGQIQQVLLNLAINARDAMPRGGTLALSLSSTEDWVTITVEDSGEGFDAAVRERLFEPFFTTKAVGSGTGLGLAVVYGIVQHHRGRIEVESTPAIGSCFRVILPAAEPGHEPVTTAAPEERLAVATALVLLVEDEEGVRDGITMLLEMIGYEVIAVGRGEDALQLPLEPVPDLLLSDVSLPGIGGAALAEKLRERWPLLKVTLMTGYADAVTREQASAQKWTILQKPFELQDLSSHLGREME